MISLVNAATLAATLRAYLRDTLAESFILYKRDIRQILDIVDNNIAVSFKELNYAEKDSINTLVTVELLKQGIMTHELPVQPEVMPPSKNCPEPHLWSCFDGVATEVEVLEFLHALVRMLKPKFILETGTYLGHGAVYMALAQKKNGFGDILTCDTDSDVLQQAITLAITNEVEKHIQFVNRKGIDVIPQLDDRCLDMVFIDSGDVETRKEEIRLVIPKLKKGAVGIAHDLNTYPDLEKLIGDYACDNTLAGMYIDETPRGLSLFVKL